MPTTINADTIVGGAVVTGDTSGVLELQSGGVTGLTVNGANVTTAGNLTVTGSITATGGGIPSLASPLAVIGNSTAGAEIRLPEDTDNGSNYVALKAPNSLTSNLTLTLPSADGTSGQVLQTNGSGTLSFATPAAGALVFLSSQTVSSSTAAVSFTSGINSTYDDYLITFENVQFTTVGGNYVMITVRLQQSGSFQTGSTYDYTVLGVNGTATEIENAVNQTRMFIQTGRYGTFGDAPRSGFLYLLNVNSTASRGCGVTAVSTSRGTAANRSQTATGGGTSSVAAAVTGIQFLSDNNIDMTAGTFRLYGIAKS